VGVDLVNSSLGYSTFDDPKMNFTYGDMNGKVSRASRAANLASKKGMLVVSSAGNEGNQSWHYIGSPADADGIVTVGAVTSKGISSAFSSYGPSSDGRVKPEVCAMGTSSAVVNTAGVPIYGNGTSFASPVLAGMMACLLQRYKSLEANLDLDILLNAVFRSAGLYSSPTAQQGYGIPDFEKAEQNLITFDKSLKTDKRDFILTYNSLSKRLTVRYIGNESISNASVRVFTVMGGSISTQRITSATTYIDTATFRTGIYAVCIYWNGKTETRKILIR
jgi:subtilisin family serine protease